MIKLVAVKISIKFFLLSMMGFFSVLTVIFFLLRGSSSLFNAQTLALFLGIVFLMAVILVASKGHLFVQSAVLVVFFSVFVLPRIMMYFFLPDMVHFPFQAAITPAQINSALVYVLVGTVAIYAGFWLAERVSRLKVVDLKYIEPVVYPTYSLLIVFIFTTFVVYYIQVIMGSNYLARLRPGSYNIMVQLAMLVFNIDTVFFMAVISLLLRKTANMKSVIAIVFLSVAYFIMSSLYGSRSVGLRIILMMVFIFLCIWQNFKIKLWYFVVPFLLLFAGLSFYPLATQKRINTVTRSNSNIAFTKDGISLYKDIEKLTTTIMDRMGIIDYAIMIITQPVDAKAKAKFMTFSYALRSTINTLVPGVAFRDAQISTSRLIPVLYRARSYEDVAAGGYFSEFYTPWGLSYLFFGWTGGLCMLMAAAFAIHGLYRILFALAGKYRFYLCSLSLFTFSNLFLSNMGFDHWISTSILIIISGIIALFMFNFLEISFRAMRILPGVKSFKINGKS